MARCPMPNAGVVSMVVSSVARRRNLLLSAFRSPSTVVQDWPEAGTNCRSSVPIRQAPERARQSLLLGFQLFELGIDGFGVGALEYRVDLAPNLALEGAPNT
jgi:hypothetical protein